MCILRLRFSLLCVFFFAALAAPVAQEVIRGQVIDGDTGDPVFAAGVLVQGSTMGTSTDFDGRFRLEVPSLPVRINVSFIGYAMLTVEVKSAADEVRAVLQPDAVLMEEAEVVGSRIDERQKQGPLTVESMDVLAIKEAPSGNFYEGLGNLKGVDLTSASLGFKIINTRGFNSTSPVRSLQLIDGVDNQSPGLNFSLGNFLGAPDLDVKSVEIVAGASSAYFGPGAFNGVINMETKDPFVFDGLNVSYRMGERNLFEGGLRWAQVIDNKDGDAVFAYKFNVFAFSAYDWEATNYSPVDSSWLEDSFSGRFDAVNIYGDEYSQVLDFSGSTEGSTEYIGLINRPGYREVDLVDYNTNNVKVSMSGHWRLQPEKKYESPELIYGFNMGRGTTVYQGDNRFSLRDIEFYQHKVELRKKGSWFIRAYRTSEDAGNSYDPYATALRIQDSLRSDKDWARVYLAFWNAEIDPQIEETYPAPVTFVDSVFADDGTFLYWQNAYFVPEDSIKLWEEQNAQFFPEWHSSVEQLTSDGGGDLFQDLIIDSPSGHATADSERFRQLFEHYTTRRNNPTERGTKFSDKSALTHLHAEKLFQPWWVDEIRLGANYRQYNPDSDGTIFSDTGGVSIRNWELGAYAGIKRRFFSDKVISTATVRLDYNQNFMPLWSPAASLVWTPNNTDFVRFSFSSALRNPTLADQYLFLDVGPATLVGNLEGREGLVTIESFQDYRASASGANLYKDEGLLEYFNISPIRPEQVQTVEFGYRTTLSDKLYLDANVYKSWYEDFIGYNFGLDLTFIEQTSGDITIRQLGGVEAYRYASNSQNEVQTQGASLGFNYFIDDHFTLNGNYSWNKLVKTDEDDPIIPAFNTPEHKYNVGLTARGLDGRDKDKWGFGLNYRWVQGFVFEGSPQFTGFVPSYDLLDVQANYKFDGPGLTFKAGASNLLRNEHIETYGGPTVGRLAYLSLALDVN